MHKLILHQKKFWIIARPSFAYTTSELWRNQWLSDKSWKIHKHAWRRRYRFYLKNGSNSFIETMNNASAIIKERCPKIYSQELVEHLFFDFYTKNEYLCEKLSISWNTSSKYLHELAEAGILVEEKIGKTKLYKNAFLYNLIKVW